MIRFENLSVKFRNADTEYTAVDKVNLTINKGEFFGIVGASGAGKSTLVRTVNLLQKPTSGNVYINGKNIVNYSGITLRNLRQNIGMIFQHFNLISNATVYDNIAFALKASKTPAKDIQKRVPELLELVGLADKADLYPPSLSGGQKQRVAIARALANNPEILLCDEATSALDPDNTKEVIQTLRNIKNHYPITILFITHQMEVAKSLFDRIAVMEKGHLAEVAPSYTLFATPQSEAAKALISSDYRKAVPKKVLEQEKDLYMITYKEQGAFDPVISDVSRKFLKTDVSIIEGNIEYVQDKPIGRLLISLRSKDDKDREEVISYLKQKTFITRLNAE